MYSTLSTQWLLKIILTDICTNIWKQIICKYTFISYCYP